jgi:gamma-glutamyltranspeptidase/glutathione hydrolase
VALQLLRRLRALAYGSTLLLLCGAPQARADELPAAPEAATGFADKPGWVAEKFMVTAANPLAVAAGVDMLKAGGSAMDAAIAVQMVLNLVEPQSSGIGGGAVMLYFDGKQSSAFDGRETAPASADEHLFQDDLGQPLGRAQATIGGRAVGAPGVLRMLDMAHRQYGKLPWAKLFQRAIELAENGFPVSPRLHELIKSDRYLAKDPVSAAYFYDAKGQPWPVGHVLKNPALAKTLREIAAEGIPVFYQGHIAKDIVAKVRSHATNPGLLTVQDIASYQARVRQPVCSDYRRFTVCGMPPPSSGGIAVAQMLGILENRDMAALSPKDGALDPEAVHLFVEAGRLAYADRNRYVADTDFVPLPGNGVASLLDRNYLKQRASLIGEKSMGRAKAGVPPGVKLAQGEDNALEYPSTSHMSIVDANGHALAMTTTVESAFGSRQMVDGFMLNNQLTDFSFDSVDANGPIANRVQGGKRPRSSMAPTLVFDKDSKKLLLTVGAPGGTAIINYVAKTLVGMIDWGLNVQQAINLPNIGSRNGPTELEQGLVSESLQQALKARGHTLYVSDQNSGLHGIARVMIHGKEWWFGGADPRREGVAQGE